MPHLAQVNIARFVRPIDDPDNRPFIEALDSVNAEADGSEGFVWRLTGAGADAMDVQAFEDANVVINMSVWEDLRSLTAFAYRNDAHVSIMRRRRDWFAPMDVSLALWWIPDGHIPTVAEAVAKLSLIERLGSTVDAFTFARPFEPDALLAAGPATATASVG